MKMLKRVSLSFMALFVSMSFLLTAKAYDTVGSIKLVFEDRDISEMSFSIYKIGNLSDGTYVEYTPSLPFDDLKSDLNSLETAKDCDKLIDECHHVIVNKGILPTKQLLGNDKGTVQFNDLELGLYLVKQDNPTESFHTESSLISVPMYTDSSLEFNVVAQPKYSTYIDFPIEDEVLGDDEVPTDTGDHQQIMPYVVTFLLSGGLAIALYKFTNKEEHTIKK